MESPGKNTARWRLLANGYNKYWYSKSALRWLALTAAVIALITFGATWPDYSHYSIRSYTIPLDWESFTIAAPLFTVILNVLAIFMLFRTR
ncbi:hypothetical protein QM012_005071 [Aureobasidium pullulans]|uniref:Uncharacterized protein n=1 Tax=Aureobasidium pullulans TaxID=5580 RepID=A0ABR0T6B8_AURPU